MNPNDINADFYDKVYAYIKGPEITEQECLLITSLIDKEQGNILDIGAGTGRHAIPLAERGFQVTAIDSSEKMLAKINNSNLLKNFTFNKDIFKFHPKQNVKYDMIILMWNAFNEISLTKVQARKLIHICKNLLSPNGKILINIDNPTSHPFIPKFRALQELDGVKYELKWSNVKYFKRTHTTISEELISIDGQPQTPALITQRWWTLAEVSEFARESGLTMTRNKIKQNAELYLVLSLQ